jgi:hypothetical protein
MNLRLAQKIGLVFERLGGRLCTGLILSELLGLLINRLNVVIPGFLEH